MRVSKHHGLGNDFLVLLDPDGVVTVDAELARAWCDRRTGVGADGLLHAGPGADGADVTMTLRNADGSRAEMSGNGIRCLAHAVARQRGIDAGRLVVDTDGGRRSVELQPTDDPLTVLVRVDMGEIRFSPAPELGLAAKETLGADIGNPHVVALFGERAALDEAADRFAMTDRNVEFVLPGPGDDEITMRVVERGAGETRACGTGACAAAWAAHRWGLTGRRVTVHMPGGAALVELGADGGAEGDTVHLTGPAVFVADVELPPLRRGDG